MKARDYYNKLIDTKKMIAENFKYETDFDFTSYEEDNLIKMFQKIIDEKRAYLLTNNMFIYIVYNSLGKTHSTLDYLRLMRHLDNLVSDNIAIAIEEIYNSNLLIYNVYQFNENNCMVFKGKIYTDDNDPERRNVREIIYMLEAISRFNMPKKELWDCCEVYVVLEQMYLTILSCATYEKEDFDKYIEYMHEIYHNLIMFLEKLYFRSIAFKDKDSGKIDYISVHSFISYFLEHKKDPFTDTIIIK